MKLHKICFRDEISFEVSQKEPFAPRTNPLSVVLAPKVLPSDDKNQKASNYVSESNPIPAETGETPGVN